MRRLVVWPIAAAVAGTIVVATVGFARVQGDSAQPPTMPRVSVTACPGSAPDACLATMERIDALPASALPRITVPHDFTYLRGELLRKEGDKHAGHVFAFRSADGHAYQVLFHLIDASHRFPTVDRRPIGTTPTGRQYRKTVGSHGVIAIGFQDTTFQYVVVGYPPGILLTRSSGTLGYAETLLDSVRREATP